MYSNIVRIYETLSTYDLDMRNTETRFDLVSCYKKHFVRYQMKNAVSYKPVLTVFHLSKAGICFDMVALIYACVSHLIFSLQVVI